MGSVHSLNINPHGGVPKYPVKKIRIGTYGIEGDKQNDLKYHGGPTRAVCIFSLEKITALQAEGNPISSGSTGENITIKGIDWDLLKMGLEIYIGEVCIKLTGVAPPCKTINKSFNDGRFNRISEKSNPGWSRWYASVIKKGVINSGDIVSIQD